MGDKKKLPTGLAEKQGLQRQATINKVLRACANIRNEGGKVMISALIEHTGLSRSTFAKPHIQELLVEHGYASGDGGTVVYKCRRVKQDDAIAEKDKQIAELKSQNTDLERECEILRGRMFLAMQK